MKAVNLREYAVKEPQKFNELTLKCIDYHPCPSEITLMPCDTGGNCMQVLKTQMNLIYYPFFFNSRVYLIPKGRALKKVFLSTIIGVRGESRLLKKCNRELYSNEKLGATGVALSRDMLQQMPQHLKAFLEDCFIAVNSKRNDAYLTAITSFGQIYWRRWNCKLAIFPVIRLSKDIMVNLEEQEEKPM